MESIFEFLFKINHRLYNWKSHLSILAVWIWLLIFPPHFLVRYWILIGVFFWIMLWVVRILQKDSPPNLKNLKDLLGYLVGLNIPVLVYLTRYYGRDYLSEFVQRFGDVTESSLRLAATYDPHFLVEFISFGEVQPLTYAIALSQLWLSNDDSFLDFLKSRTKHKNSLIREGAFQGLAAYYLKDENKHRDLLVFFRKALAKEPRLSVQKQIIKLLTTMEVYAR